MDEIDSKLQLFHRIKILTMNEVKAAVEYNKVYSNDSKLINVPYGLQTNTVLTNSEPVQCSLYAETKSNVNYIAFYGSRDENGLCSWLIEKDNFRFRKRRKKLGSLVTNAVYVPSCYLIFAFCKDLTIRTFGPLFQEQSILQLGYSILCMKYNEKTNQIVTGCIGFVQQWKLNANTHNAPQLIKEVHLEFSNKKPWVHYLEFVEEKQLTVALTGNLIYFLDSTNLNTLMTIKNLNGFLFSTCLTYLQREYFLTASWDGSIKVWNVSMKTCPYVGCFNGHTAKVIKLDVHPCEDILISASEDSTIRLWRFETFQETHRFDSADSIGQVFLINSRLLYYTSKFSLHILDINLFHTLFTVVGSNLNKVQRVKPSKVLSNDYNQVSRILVTADDGGVRIVSPVHGNILTMLFPIVSHKVISYHHDPIEEILYALLKEEQGILLISTLTNPCRAVQLLCFPEKENAVICLELIYVEIEYKTTPLLIAAHKNGKISLLYGRGFKMKPQICDGGFVITIIPSQNNLRFDFITCTSESHITLWKVFKVNYSTLSIFAVHKFQVEGHILNLVASDNIIGFTLDKAIFLCKVVIQTNGEVDISRNTHSNDQSHLTSVTELTACSSIPIFASASKDGKVKIWDASCMLIRELCFDETLSGMCFCNDRGDILVGFQKNLHHVSVTEYLPQSYLETLLEQNIEDDKIEYCTPFDPNLKFWYDSRRVPVVTKLSKKTFDHIKEFSLKLKHQKSTTKQKESTVNQNMIDNNALMTSCKSKQTPGDNIKPISFGKIRKYKDNRFAEKILSKKLIEKSEAITYKELHTFNFKDSKALSFEEKSITTTNEVLLSERYVWPFAPDCFIPNSIVRSFRKPAYPFIDRLARMTDRLSKQDNVPEEIDFENNFEFSDNDENYLVTNTKTFSFLSGIKEQISRPDKQGGIFVEKRKLRDDTFTSEKKKTRQNTKSIVDNIKEKKRNKILTKRIPKNEVINQSPKTEIESASIFKILPTPQIEIESVPLIECVPPPYNEYTDKEWFPRDIGSDQNFVISYLINQLNTSQPLVFKEILAAITKIHSYYSMSNELFEKFIQILLSYLENPSGQIRHYAVSAFLALSPNRRDVLLKLIPKLNDPIDPVKDAVKRLLNEMAGIKDADTLASVIRELGEMKSGIVSNDKEVIESFKDTIITNKESFRKLSKLVNSSNSMEIKSQISTNITDKSIYKNIVLSNKSLQSDYTQTMSTRLDETDERTRLDDTANKKIIVNTANSQNLLSPKHKSKIDINDNAFKKNLSDSNQNKLQVLNNKPTEKSDLMYSDLEENKISDMKNKYKNKIKVKETRKQKSALKNVIKAQGNYSNDSNSATKKPNRTITTNLESWNNNPCDDRLITSNRSSQDTSIKVFDKNTRSYRNEGSIINEEHKKLELDGRILYNDSLRVTKLGPYKEEKMLLSKLLGLFKDEDIWHLNILLHENMQETTEHLATKLASKLYKRFKALKSNPRSMPKFMTNSFSKIFQVESNEGLQSSLNVSKSLNTLSESYKGTTQMIEEKKQLETLGANKIKEINKKNSKLIEISNTQINNFDTQMNKPENFFFYENLNLPIKPPNDSFSFEENESNDQACCFYKTTNNLNKRNESKSQTSFGHAISNNREIEKMSVKQIKSLFKVPPSIKKGNKLTSKAPLFNNETQNQTEEKEHVSLFKVKENKVLLPEISFTNTINKLNSNKKKKKAVLTSSLTDYTNLSSNQKSEYEINNCSADNISMLLNFLRKGHSVKKKEHLSMKLKKFEKLSNIKNSTARSQSMLFTLEEAEQMLRKLNSLQKLNYKTIQSGVCGERILCRLETIASNYNYETITKVIESLPERYGCQIVSVDSGITMYGSLSFYWKSLCNTDLSLNYHQSDPTRNENVLLTIDNKFHLKPCFLRF
ncbi:uncharacterized protein LOC100211484 isoform X2 [Hydra vulgaris]|uniref:uncharacterized protein LOC100211484 isoform X2 n=1 Tax=Hydra vulgaris TaxID=6087 RepID=UPI0032EA3728